MTRPVTISGGCVANSAQRIRTSPQDRSSPIQLRPFRARRRSFSDQEGALGIGAMVLFIAVILTASISAGLLLNMAFFVGEQAETTGDAAVHNVGTVFLMNDVLGDRGSAADGNILDLQLKLSIAAGSAAIAMEHVIIEVTTGTTELNLVFDSGASQAAYQHEWDDRTAADETSLAALASATSMTYTAMELRDPDGTFYSDAANSESDGSAPTYTVSQGCLIKVFIDLTGATLGNQDSFTVKIIPKHGVPTTIIGETPESYSDRYVPL